MSTSKRPGRPQLIAATAIFVAAMVILGLRMAGVIGDPIAVPVLGISVIAAAALTVWGGLLSASRRSSAR